MQNIPCSVVQIELTPVPLSQTSTLFPLESMAVLLEPTTLAKNKMAATNFLNA